MNPLNLLWIIPLGGSGLIIIILAVALIVGRRKRGRPKKIQEYMKVQIIHMETLADKECTCTPEQEQGEAYPECESCMAAHALNTLGDIIREFSRDFPVQKTEASKGRRG